MGKKLYVGNLSYGVDENGLSDIFSPFGTVESVAIVTDRETGRIQTFRLDRMSSVAPQDGVAVPPADFDLNVFASQSFGIYQDEIEDVAIHISPQGADEARSWRWHPTQTFEDQPDGAVIVRFRASGMRELAWHLFTWGEQAVILSPERLKTAMARELAAAGRALQAAHEQGLR